MANKVDLDRPELAFGPNIFIELAAPFIPFKDWPARLRRYPLKDIGWRSFPPQSREALLDRHKLHFVPYDRILEPAADLQRLFRAGLSRRNPITLAERIRTVQVATATDVRELQNFEALDGGGGIWSGMTGTGRTALVRRVLDLICPQQVIELGSSEVYGWKNLTHVGYLHLDFATNGSRGGFLKRVLRALDEATGTSLSDDHRKVSNIDVLLLEVCRQLSNVRCVLVVIDEKQGSNFEESPWKLEFLLFYLSLMNLGINVMMLGNPLAFVHLRMFSQVMRRFSAAGQYEFQPASSQDETWWKTSYMPRVRKFDLMDAWNVSTEWRDEFEFRNTAGIQGLAPALNVEVQLCAIRRSAGSDTVTVEDQDFEAAIKSPRFAEQRQIALSVRGLGQEGHAGYIDLPPTTSTVADADSTIKDADSVPIGASIAAAQNGPFVDVVGKLLKRFKAETTRKSNNLMAQLKSLKSLDPYDLRILGVGEDHMAGLQKLVDSTEASKSRRSRERGPDVMP